MRLTPEVIKDMDKRQISDKYAEIGMALIESQEELADIGNSQATVIFLASEHAKKAKEKTIFAECEKVSEKYKWGIPADFTITVFEPNIENFTEEQIKILLFHELLHVGIEFKANGEEVYFVRPHDLEDFKVIIDKYGTEWNKA